MPPHPDSRSPLASATSLHPPLSRSDSALTLSIFITWAWGMATVLGAVMLLGSGVVATGSSLSFARAVFFSVSASTLTGFTTTLGFAELTRFGQTVVLLLHIVGILASLIVGGLATKRIARLNVPDGSVISAAFSLLALASVIGLLTRNVGGGGADASNAPVFGAVAAFGALAGSGLRAGPPPDPASPVLVTLLLPLFAFGSLGTTVLLDMAQRLRNRPSIDGLQPGLTPFTRITLVGTTLVLFALFTLYLCLQPTGGDTLSNLAAALSRSVGAMGWGLLPIATEDARALPPLLLLPAALGVTPGATAAGLGIPTLVLLARTVWANLGGRAVSLPIRRLAGIAAVTLALIFLLGFTTWLSLLTTEPQLPADRLALVAFGAVANAPVPTRAPVGIVDAGMLALAAAMALGRALPLAALWAAVLLLDRTHAIHSTPTASAD